MSDATMSDATLVYDDDCGFCTWWAEFFADSSEVELVGFSELTDDLRERLPENYEDCSHLLADGEVYSCGESMEQAFARANLGEEARSALDFLRNFEDYNRLRENAYRKVADHRGLLGQFLSSEPPARRESGSD